MNLDFGSIDVMRDKHDGRIYIVDVNKTCMPVLCLSLKTQIKSQKKIAEALTAGLSRMPIHKKSPDPEIKAWYYFKLLKPNNAGHRSYNVHGNALRAASWAICY